MQTTEERLFKRQSEHTTFLLLHYYQQTQEVNQNLAVSKGEYWCPLCRQLANSVIPILPEESKYTIVKPASKNLVQMATDIAEMMIKRPITPVRILNQADIFSTKK